jgi:L-threonylcarbamoyladenylate synthase
MKTKKAVKLLSTDNQAHKKTAEIVKNGGIAIVPTETVYGFTASVFNQEARKRIYAVKGRSYKKPLVIMTPDIESVQILADIPVKALKIANKFWPGQLTLIFPATELGRLLSGGRDNLGIRIPDNEFMLKFLREIGTPVWTTSVNISGTASAKSFEETLQFENLVEAIIDGGRCKYSLESTVIDMVKFPYIIIRKGSLDAKEILKYI